jgi:hypothetical protein
VLPVIEGVLVNPCFAELLAQLVGDEPEYGAAWEAEERPG